MIKYLLDSDVIIEYLKDDSSTIDLIKEIKDDGLACSVLTIIEVKRGLYPKQELQAEDLFRIIEAYPVNKKVAELAVEFAKEWQQKGRHLQLVDVAIATTCVINDLTLVTYNKRDYPMKDLKIL